jgi:hypothetical protein
MQFSNICNFKYYREKQNCIYSIIYQNINSRKWQWRIISKIDKIHTQTIRFSNKLVGKDIRVIPSDVNFMTLSNTRYVTGNIQDFYVSGESVRDLDRNRYDAESFDVSTFSDNIVNDIPSTLCSALILDAYAIFSSVVTLITDSDISPPATPVGVIFVVSDLMWLLLVFMMPYLHNLYIIINRRI